jgi:RNA polymerase sigma-70 factor (ECF subfamily)
MTPNTNMINKWVDEYTNEMYSWAYHKVSDAEMAKDLVQDTFLVAVTKIGSFKNESSPKTWLFSILNYKIIDFYRKKAKHLKYKNDGQFINNFFDDNGDWKTDAMPDQWDEDNHLLDNSEFQDVLDGCLEELPETWNHSIKLKYLMKKNGAEICQELNISPTNFWQIVHRAKLQLRNCIEINWFKK